MQGKDLWPMLFRDSCSATDVMSFIKVIHRMERAHLQIVDIDMARGEIELQVRGTSCRMWLFLGDAVEVITRVVNAMEPSPEEVRTIIEEVTNDYEAI